MSTKRHKMTTMRHLMTTRTLKMSVKRHRITKVMNYKWVCEKHLHLQNNYKEAK